MIYSVLLNYPFMRKLFCKLQTCDYIWTIFLVYMYNVDFIKKVQYNVYILALMDANTNQLHRIHRPSDSQCLLSSGYLVVCIFELSMQHNQYMSSFNSRLEEPADKFSYPVLVFFQYFLSFCSQRFMQSCKTFHSWSHDIFIKC